MPKLSKALGGNVELWIKRDDLLPGAAGGNKTRKLEFSIGEAIAQGADSLITYGAVQSNHCRLTLSLARKEGLECHLIIEESTPGAFNPAVGGNAFLFHLLGASSIRAVPDTSDALAELQKTAEELQKVGKKPYIIPIGASNTVGSLGYALFAEEIMGQINEAGLNVDCLITPSGSAGTQAGIVTGFYGINAGISVIGMNVSRPREPQEAKVHKLVLELAEKLSIPPVPRELVVCADEYVGPGYAKPSEAMKEAVYLFAREEGILLDPVYSGKTAAGLIDFVRKNKFAKGSAVVFLHTGGTPALYVYQDFLI
jgi:D-cysteine desulfhydrase